MARSRNIGGIYAELSLRDSKFRSRLKGAQQSLLSFGKGAAKAGAVVAGALAASMAVGAKRTIAMGAELDHLATQTGISVSSLIKLRQAYKDNGKSAESLGKDVGKMQRAIYDAAQDPGSSIDYFAELGLSAEKLMEMSPEDQFFEIGEAIKKTGDKTKQAALALSIFGRSGGELLTVFEGTTLEDVNASLGKMPEIMEEFSGAMERADTLMGRLPNKSDQFFSGFTAGIVGQILPGLEMVNDKDFTELGKSLGDKLSEGLQLLTDGTVWEVFRLQGEKALLSIQGSTAMSGFASTVNAVWDGITGDSSFDFNEAFDRYAEAGINANAEIAADLDAQIAKLLRDNQIKVEKRQKEVAAIGKKEEPSMSGGFSPIPDWMKTDYYRTPPKTMPGGETEDAREPMWKSSSYEVNSMQARGLGMGALYVRKENDKQTTILEEIKRILSNAETDGALKWA